MTNTPAYNFPLVLSQFLIKGDAVEIKPYGSGHIHDTFHVVTAPSESPDYLLQRINNRVFQNVPALMENIQRVTMHLRKKIGTLPGSDIGKEVLTLVPTKRGSGFYQDSGGNFWRMYYFLNNTRSYDIVRTVQQASEGGKAIGRFLALLSDLNSDFLHETIPHFHDVEIRFQQLQTAIEANSHGRVKEVLAEIAFVKNRIESMSTICRLGREGRLPIRVTHNDTKFNNVLLNDLDQAQCVIDLDTVMPGFIAYDFGDAVRTVVSQTFEDETDIEKIDVNIELFRGFTNGFMNEAKDFLVISEIDSLAEGVLLMPFIMGVRFLTDYIEGDNYYKANFPGHNRQRARVQFRLVKKLEENLSTLQKIILNR